MKKRKKKWVSATISPENYRFIKQKARELFNDEFAPTLDYIITTYRSIWTDLMMAELRTQVYQVFEKVKALKEKQFNM